MPSVLHLLGALTTLAVLSQAAPSAAAYGVSPSLNAHRNKLGAVASEARECTEIGIDTLRRGGNAADALVATQICVGVVGMYHSGQSRKQDITSMSLMKTIKASAEEASC